MKYFYVEDKEEFEIQDFIDGIIMDCKTIYDHKGKVKYLKIGSGFDIETSKIEISEDFVTAYCYHWQFGLGKYAVLGRNLERFYDFLFMLIESIKENKPKCKLLVYDANLGYEWQFCKHYFKRIGVSHVFAKEKRNPISIELQSTIIFREVLGLFGNSLAQIAKNYLNIKKLTGDLDFSKVRLSNTYMDEKEIGYCVRDVEILVRLAEEYIYKNYFGKNSQLPYTSTGIVRNAIKKELGKNLKAERDKMHSWMPTEDEYNLFRQYLFKGGICGSNIIRMNKVYKDCVKGADITSDYPYQMFTKKFPMGKPIMVSCKDFLKTDNPYIAIIRFNRFRSKSSHALMSIHKALNSYEFTGLMPNSKGDMGDRLILDNNRIQYCEDVELVVNDIEFKSLMKAYYWEHATVMKCWEFKEGYARLPKHVIKICLQQYLVKEELKSKGLEETQEYRDSKAFVNGIFGMCATALFREEWVYDDDEVDIIVQEDEEHNKVTKPYDDCCKFLFLSPFWGFWITSYAREMLIDVITRFPRCIIQYDTDSVYYITGSEEADKLENYLKNQNIRMERLNDFLFMHNERMRSIGTWDFTPTFSRFKALGSKRYMYEYLDKHTGEKKIKVVISGCRKSKDGKISTLVLQNEYNNKIKNENKDPFDFFSDGMLIDKEHSEKLASSYVDESIMVDYNDYLGNTETIYCPSSVVLFPIEFRMSLNKSHKNLLELAVKRYAQNTNERKIYDIWRELKKSNI